jgi:competence protein ComEC
MAKFHFLNVGPGSCSVIQHASGHVTMKDICNGNAARRAAETRTATIETLMEKMAAQGNFAMCRHPTQPLDYLSDNGIDTVFRFILSHPDMDHMDGLASLFEDFTIHNYWDTGVRKQKPPFGLGSPYKEEDWDCYEDILAGKKGGLTVLLKREGAQFELANKPNGGDGLHILAPNKAQADAVDDETNDASYVVLYRSIGGKILLPGDAHDATWDHIKTNHAGAVSNCSILVAPHHGRDSDMDFGFLETVNPKLVLMGCAKSKDLAYDKYRKYNRISNNQAGNVVAEIDSTGMDIFVENEKFAAKWGDTSRQNAQGYYFVMRIDKED